MEAPTPNVKQARQFFDRKGEEVFYAEAYGRRPDVIDALRVMGKGHTRVAAIQSACTNWKKAWCSLATKSRLKVSG